MNDNKTAQQQIEHLKAICKKADIKLTHQRLEIFKALMASTDHPSAELIHQRLQQTLPTIAIDTVYRTLATFNNLGIIRKLHVMENECALFDTNLKQHQHFICTRCKAVKDLYWNDFDDRDLSAITKDIGQIHSKHLELHGLCNDCLNENR